MKWSKFFLLNILVLPLVLLIGNFSNYSIALFWVLSLVLGIHFLRPVIKNCGVLFLLSPCMLTYFYSIANYVTGSLYYCTDFLIFTRLYQEFFSISHAHLFFILVFLNTCNSIVAIIGAKNPVYFFPPSRYPKTAFNVFTILFLLLFFVLLHVFIFDLSVIGGSAKGSQVTETKTGMNYPFILGIVIMIVYKLNTYRTPTWLHLLIIGAIVLVMAIDSVGSKRELFFMLIAILIIELIYHDRKIKITIKSLALTIVVVFVAFYYILSASIVRGYGGFGVEELSDATSLVADYVGTDTFNEVVGNNFETPYHYSSSVLSCDYTLTGVTPILFGETFIKVLFIPVPRSIYKPRKMVDVYTSAYDAQKRIDGVSYPVSVYSELFANFHILSFFFLYGIFLLFQKLYLRMISIARRNDNRFIFIVPISALFLHFFRGSGLESLIIYSAFACSTIFICMFLFGDLRKRSTYLPPGY